MGDYNKLDVYALIEPLFYISKLHGMSPHALQGKSGCRKFILSRLTLLYSGVLLASCITAQIQIAAHTSVNRADILPESVSVANLALYSISTSVLSFLSILQYNKMPEIFSRMSKYYKPRDRILQYFIFVQCLLSFTISVLTAYLVPFVLEWDGILYGICVIILYYNIMGVLVSDMQYINTVTLLKHNFMTLNLKLNVETFEQPFYEFSKRKSIADIRSDAWASDRHVELECIQNLHRFHTETHELINSTFSIQMLISTGLKFVILTSQFYFEVLHVIRSGEFVAEPMDFISICLVAACLPPLVSIAFTCSSTSHEVRPHARLGTARTFHRESQVGTVTGRGVFNLCLFLSSRRDLPHGYGAQTGPEARPMRSSG
jgi:hypothetical protein